jgi:hypothetical protein
VTETITKLTASSDRGLTLDSWGSRPQTLHSCIVESSALAEIL